MKINNNILTSSLPFLFCFTLFFSCKKDSNSIDVQLYDMAKETTGFTWFKFSDSLLEKSSGSGHPQTYLRTRYNSIASSQLDSIGKVKSNANFPEGSLIVKELFENATKLGRYAILYKQSSNADADENGWVWGYIDADGKVAVSASKKGSSCINCHTQSENIDYMLMNKFYP